MLIRRSAPRFVNWDDSIEWSLTTPPPGGIIKISFGRLSNADQARCAAGGAGGEILYLSPPRPKVRAVECSSTIISDPATPFFMEEGERKKLKRRVSGAAARKLDKRRKARTTLKEPRQLEKKPIPEKNFIVECGERSGNPVSTGLASVLVTSTPIRGSPKAARFGDLHLLKKLTPLDRNF